MFVQGQAVLGALGHGLEELELTRHHGVDAHVLPGHLHLLLSRQQQQCLQQRFHVRDRAPHTGKRLLLVSRPIPALLEKVQAAFEYGHRRAQLVARVPGEIPLTIHERGQTGGEVLHRLNHAHDLGVSVGAQRFEVAADLEVGIEVEVLQIGCQPHDGRHRALG